MLVNFLRVTFSGFALASSGATEVRASTASVVAGQTVTISVTADGTAPFAYQWYKNGAALQGANAASLVLSAVTSADTGIYTAVLSNSAGSASSDMAAVSVSSTITAPSITAQPSSLSVASGQSASFSVGAAGSGPLLYQWRKNGLNISGATSSTYTLSSVGAADAASYSAVVSNSAGTIISNAATLTVVSSGGGTTTSASSLWPSTAVPALVDAGSDSSVELGVKFKSDVAGVITGIRFYKASANTGAHVGNLWSASGALLATATFTNESSSGWQQVIFSQPVSIAANTVYVASYHVNGGHYSANLDQFATVGVDSGSLHALASGSSGGNGVYAYGSGSVFPNQTYRNTNYWVDVLFKPASAAAKTSVWTDAATPSMIDGGADNSVELGMKFKSDVAGTVTGIRFYKASTNAGAHVGNLWSSTGVLLATVTFTGESASGWQQMNLSTPVAIAANTVYVVSYHVNSGHYSVNLDFFGASGVDNGPLHALSSAAAGPNGVYVYSSGTAFPNQSFRNANYWVDVVFQPAQ